MASNAKDAGSGMSETIGNKSDSIDDRTAACEIPGHASGVLQRSGLIN
jgi:hypothetical protein